VNRLAKHHGGQDVSSIAYHDRKRRLGRANDLFICFFWKMKQYYLVSLVKECGAEFGDDLRKERNNAKDIDHRSSTSGLKRAMRMR
jgi:hypothetical protein